MDYQRLFYPESRFGDFTDVDGTITFYIRVNSLLTPSSVVLDVGCGRGAYGQNTIDIRRQLRCLRGKCASVIGIDVDTAGESNPYLDEFRLLDDHRQWPVETESVDLCLSDSVLEHVTDPEGFFRECHRVLKVGGHLCIRIPNLLHYLGLASWLIPDKFHDAIVKRSRQSREAQDVFPTVYKCNTIGRMRRMLKRFGFEHCVYGYEAEPAYGSSSFILYTLAVTYKKLAPSRFRACIFTFARKTLSK